MLRDLTILNPGDSINQRKILTQMDKITGGAPRTIQKHFYGIFNNHPDNKHDEWDEEKQRKR